MSMTARASSTGPSAAVMRGEACEHDGLDEPELHSCSGDSHTSVEPVRSSSSRAAAQKDEVEMGARQRFGARTAAAGRCFWGSYLLFPVLEQHVSRARGAVLLVFSLSTVRQVCVADGQ